MTAACILKFKRGAGRKRGRALFPNKRRVSWTKLFCLHGRSVSEALGKNLKLTQIQRILLVLSSTKKKGRRKKYDLQLLRLINRFIGTEK